MKTASSEQKNPAVAHPHKVRITSWHKATRCEGHAYEVVTEDELPGLLFIDADTERMGRSIVAIIVAWSPLETLVYRDDEILLPVELQRAITEERLRDAAALILMNLMEVSDDENPALKISICCNTLRRHFADIEMAHLLQLLTRYGEELGITHDGQLEELRCIKADCDALWPERVDADDGGKAG
jgi:hypothetical protein